MNAPFRHDVAQRASPAPSFAVPLLATLSFGLLILLLGPSGYRGGGADDFHYLEAARCAARHGFCTPQAHWWSRFPLVAPTAGVFALFGEGRAQAAAVPLAYGLAAALLLSRMMFTRYGPAAATAAGLALMATPAFHGVLLNPNIDLAELAFLLAALFFLDRCRAGGAAPWAALAGVALALAVQSRPSALCALPSFALFIAWTPALRTRIAPIALAFAAPLAAEAVLYAFQTGEPLMPWRLALSHGGVPSTELSPIVDESRSPLFNPQFIGGWRPAAGIDAHWSVQGFVNLLVHPGIGPTLIAAAVSLALARRRAALTRDPVPAVLLAAAAVHFVGLVYALAVDPKPRMFLPGVAIAAAIIGIAAARLHRSGERLLSAAIVGSLCVAGLAWSSGHPDLDAADRIAREWLRGEEGRTALEVNTATMLTLVPGVAQAADPARATRILLFGRRNCAGHGANLPAGRHWRLLRAAPIPSPIDRALDRAPRPGGLTLCLFSRDRAAAPRP